MGPVRNPVDTFHEVYITNARKNARKRTLISGTGDNNGEALRDGNDVKTWTWLVAALMGPGPFGQF